MPDTLMRGQEMRLTRAHMERNWREWPENTLKKSQMLGGGSDASA
jgi:hypothetical protein